MQSSGYDVVLVTLLARVFVVISKLLPCSFDCFVFGVSVGKELRTQTVGLVWCGFRLAVAHTCNRKFLGKISSFPSVTDSTNRNREEKSAAAKE